MDNGLQATLPGKLAGWCVLYSVAMCFIGLRIFARLHIFGSLTIDDWLMVAAGVAYTMSMITEIFVYVSLRGLNILGYIKVYPFEVSLIVVGFRFVFCCCVDHVAHQALCLVFYEETCAWKVDESVCKCCFCGLGIGVYRTECVQSVVVRANLVCLGSVP
jgi:hypothetical protein